MKKLFLMAILLSLSAGTALGQPQSGPRHGPGAGDPATRLIEELGLDESQASQVQAIFADARALHEEEREQSREAFCAIKAETDAAILQALSAEQQTRFLELQQQRPPRHARKGPADGESEDAGQERGHQKGPRGGPPDCAD